jgi:MFS family permease
MPGLAREEALVRTTRLLCAGASFAAGASGFIAFGAAHMSEFDGFLMAEIGSFLPVMGLCATTGVLALGNLNPRVVSYRTVMVASLLLVALADGGIVFWASTYRQHLYCWMVYGVGYSAVMIVPYSAIAAMHHPAEEGSDDGEVAAAEAASRVTAACTLYDMCVNVAGPALGRLLMVLGTSTVESRWGWRLAVGACGAGCALTAVLLAGCGLMPLPPPPGAAQWVEDDAKDKDEEGAGVGTEGGEAARKASTSDRRTTYLGKLHEVYMSPVAAFMLASCACMAFAFVSCSTWGPMIAHELFVRTGKETASRVQLWILGASTMGLPLGVLAAALAVRSFTRVTGAVRVAWLFLLLAVPGAVGMALSGGAFDAWLCSFVVFVAVAYYPVVVHKTLPRFFCLSPEVELVALSQFIFAFSVFGNVASPLITAMLIDRFGVATTMWVIVWVVVAGLISWTVPFVWSFRAESPVADLVEKERARASRRNSAAHRVKAPSASSAGAQAEGGEVNEGKGERPPLQRHNTVLSLHEYEAGSHAAAVQQLVATHGSTLLHCRRYRMSMTTTASHVLNSAVHAPLNVLKMATSTGSTRKLVTPTAARSNKAKKVVV